MPTHGLVIVPLVDSLSSQRTYLCTIGILQHQRNTTRMKQAIILLSLLVTSLGACVRLPTTGEKIYSQVDEMTVATSDPIPLPTSATLLTVKGLVNNGNITEDTIEMDLATIESLGQHQYTVLDPFELKENTFQGVLLSDLIEWWQIAPEATILHFVALNDYEFVFTLSEIAEIPMLFALQMNGEYMQPSYRGPAMMVLPYEHLDLDHTVYNPYWIWQIKSVIVK